MTENNAAWTRHAIDPREEQQSTSAKSLMQAAVLTPGAAALSCKALETLRHMRYYMNETDGVVLYSDCAGVMVKTGSIEEMLKEAADCAESAISCMPDFAPYNMDDGCGLLCMQESAFCFRPYALGGKPGLALEARQECIEACERQTPIAVMYNHSGDLYSID